MADCYILCALFVFFSLVKGTPPVKGQDGNALTSKVNDMAETKNVIGLYCQDPDTRKLYPINSTWPSESFCGNYTCKLRKKNITQTEYAPLAKINVTELVKNDEVASEEMATSQSEHALVVIKKLQPPKQPMFHKDAINKIKAINNELKNGDLDDNDRYLTEPEIKSISEILHTVKKSDLEAIVEIYNIAQDIFKEIDTATNERILKDSVSPAKNDENDDVKKFVNNKQKSASYWYEPLHHSSTKLNPNDLKVEGTSAIPTSRSYTHPPTYFNGPLTERDFRKLPYYYPMSNFQRMSSYLRNKPPYYMQEYIPYRPRPCSKPFNNMLPPWFNTAIKKNIPEPTKPQLMQPVLLPYPFSNVHHYNFSTYPVSFHYNNYPWAKLDVYNKHRNYPQQYFGAYFTPVPTTAIVSNVEEAEQKYDDQISINDNESGNTPNSEEVQLPAWQTEQLSDKVLEEVKANIEDKSKLKKSLSLKKHIKLEKVGKVIKLDELTKSKRSTNNKDEKHIESESVQYEPYIEKTTCESSTELGFFRMGDLTEPYPACCPQKITR